MKRVIVWFVVVFLVGCSTPQDKYFPKADPEINIVQALTIGPMIGSVTDKSFRLWGRGTKEAIGVVQFRKEDTDRWSGTRTFTFDEKLDYTATVDFTSKEYPAIKADTNYEYRIGYIHKKYKGQLSKLVWKDKPKIVHTFPKIGSATETRFILGSCRDQTIWSQKGEDTFGHIKNLLAHEKTNGLSSDFILQLGDQAYVDLDRIPFFTKAQTKNERLWQTYRKSFSWPKFRAVTSQLPSYMILDDHEIQNDWTMGRYKNNEHRKDKKYKMPTFDIGMKAYRAYQSSLNLSRKDQINHKKNWYDFSHAKSEFFVLDTRTENTMHEALTEEGNKVEPDVIGTDQMTALKKWLTKYSTGVNKDRIKFIVSPVPLFPDVKHVNNIGAPLDKWAAGVWQRHALLEHIRKGKINKIVFLSGDVHASSIAELTHSKDAGFKIYNVMASPFNWSTSAGLGLQEYNFDFAKEYRKSLQAEAVGEVLPNSKYSKLKSKCKDVACYKNPSAEYKVRRYSNSPATPLIHKKNNFSRITTHGTDSITVEFFSGHNGKLLESTEIRF